MLIKKPGSDKIVNYQELQDKFKLGELEHKRAGCDCTGRDNRWRDEDPNAVF